MNELALAPAATSPERLDTLVRGRARRNRAYVIAILLVSATFSTDAFAYLDPGTGSILLQGLIAGVAATVTFLSVYWQRTKALFRSLFSRPAQPPADDDQAPP